ncbi:hypothetical protein GGI35DRAFT_456400 [Trichoderma velutinum]
MFITLKASNNQDVFGMEQVAYRNADPPAVGGASEVSQNHAVPIRRSACLPCKLKKVRCTGQRQSCDRCRSRAIRCVMPTVRKRAIRKAGLLDGLTQQQARSTTGQSSEAKRVQRNATINQPPAAGPTMSGAQNTMAPGSDMAPHLVDCSADIERVCAAPTPSSLLKSALQFTGLTTLPRQVTPPIPAQGFGGVLDPFCDSGPCLCIENSATVLQRLEDDEFKITELSIEGVVQLQKWVMFQCCAALDCPICYLLPRVQTLIVVICDRLTEMFECLCKRLHNSTAGLTWLESLKGQHFSTASTVTDISSTKRHAQLYCSSSRGPAELASCNSAIFSNLRGDSYIAQEQLHMMRGLLNLQIEHCRSLLKRVYGVSQDAKSEARQAKVEMMIARLDTADTQINYILSLVL